MNTKFIFCYIHSWYEPSLEYKERMLAAFLNRLNFYKNMGEPIDLPLPVDIQIVPVMKTIKTFWRKKEVEVVDYNQVVLMFDKELSQQEMNLWRCIKTGWVAKGLMNYL